MVRMKGNHAKVPSYCSHLKSICSICSLPSQVVLDCFNCHVACVEALDNVKHLFNHFYSVTGGPRGQ